MNFDAIVSDNAIIICNNDVKKNILSYLNTIPNLYSINFMTINEIKKKIFFDYDKKTIYYLIKNYHIPYEVAEMYIKNMYYIEDENYSNKKLDELVKYKKELENNNLLIKDELFLDLIKNKKIIFVSKSLSNYDKHILDILRKYTEVSIYQYDQNNYDHEIYEFPTIEKEVEYVAYSICELISKGVNINNIKIANIDDEYMNIIKRIFGYFNIPINLPNNSYLIGTKIAADFIKNYSSNINDTINAIKEYEGSYIYNLIINICNKYNFIDDYNEVKDMIIYDMSKVSIPNIKYQNAIEIIDYKYALDTDYVFLMNFNLKSIPKIHKDEDYITDDIKPKYMDTTIEQNINEKKETIDAIKNIKNLIITYKLSTPTSECYPSNLVDASKVKRPTIDIYKSYSKINDEIKLATSLDKLIKYGSKDEYLNALKYNYDIPYLQYNNKYKKVDISNLYKIVDNKLSLSYSSLEQYNECAFKYYLSNILKLNIYEENFSAILGTIFHHILEIGVGKSIDVDKEIDLFLTEKYPNRVFSKKETFFIENTKENIKFVLDAIAKQMQLCKLNGIKKEERVYISKDKNLKISFTGVIDKLLYKETDDMTIMAIIDYKTGNSVDIDLSYMESGIGLQLPIYILLAKNMDFKNIKFAGIYLQKVMPSIEKVGDKLTREDKLKLEGYSNCDKNILSEFDITYSDSSVIKGLKLKNDGHFRATSKVMTDTDFDDLATLADKEIDKCINHILNADFEINPIQKDKSTEILGCKYCNYKDICFRTYLDVRKITRSSIGGDADE